MSKLSDFETLNVNLLVDMLDPQKEGHVSLNRLVALAKKLQKKSDKKKRTVKKSAAKLAKAFIFGAFIILSGIFVFIELEHDNYERKIESNRRLKEDDIDLCLPVGGLLADILNLTSQYDEDLDTNIRDIYSEYLNETLWEKLVTNGFASSNDLANPWKFESTAWFVFTIATTVGYGHIVPLTSAGYLFVIFYSVPAIIWMAYFIKQLINFYKICPHKLASVKAKVLAIIALFILYLSVSGLTFSHLQQWTFLQGVYFTWVTISTIGFGDYTFRDGKWWENTTNLFIILNGLFLASYVISVVAEVIERITKPELWKEAFSKSMLSRVDKINPLKIPFKISPRANWSKKLTVYPETAHSSSDGGVEAIYASSEIGSDSLGKTIVL